MLLEIEVRPPLKSIQVGSLFEHVGMDFKQMDISHSGNRYALVLQDYLTKWPEVYPISSNSGQVLG